MDLFWQGVPHYLIKIALSLAALLLVLLLRRIGNRTLSRGTSDKQALFALQNALSIGLYLGLLLALVFIWLEGFAPLVTVLGLVAVGLTIICKEIILNFLACLVVLWRGLFSIGDRIQVGEHSGDVLHVGMFYFTLMETGSWSAKGQSTGRLVKVPNSMVLVTPILNATKASGHVWNEFSFVVDPSSNWEEAKSIASEVVRACMAGENRNDDEIMRRMNQQYALAGNLSPKIYTCFAEKGVRLTVRYLCPTRNRRDSENAIVESLLRDLHKRPDIKLVF